MKNRILKNLMAISCLVSINVYSSNSPGSGKNDLRPIGQYAKERDSLIKMPQRWDQEINSDNTQLISSGDNEHKRLSSSIALDWTKAPNSYIFDPSQNYGGLLVPVKKAYAMWVNDKYVGNEGVPNGKLTADVLWEDVPGLIISEDNYALEIMDAGQNAKIRVPVNRSKEGNAVIAFRVNGEIFWSWHIWVTDDPTKGSTYRSFENLTRERNDSVVESIPDSDWKWMDRDLGSISGTITGTEWNRNGGLLYQWGRKDPIPPLVYRGNDFYEVSGSIGRVRHRGAKNFTNAIKIDDLRKFVLLSNAEVKNNVQLSVRNPLSLIYVNKDDNSGPAYYNNNTNLMVNWFGKSPNFKDSQLTELNLWSDNSLGKINSTYNTDASAQPYRDKSAYDPCPNGWRIPSALVANLASTGYVDDIRVDFSPFGVRTNTGKDVFESNGYHIIKPTDANLPSFMKGIKLYSNIGFDLSNVGGYNMGLFPGTGEIEIDTQAGQYADQHHTSIWTATMARQFDSTPATTARGLFMIPDKAQPDVPDANFPNVKGRFQYVPLAVMNTSGANGCRCVKDPLYLVDSYDFPTEFLNAPEEYTEGINNPNSYQIIKAATASTIEIPVSKAFSVQNQLLNNQDILNPANYNNLKANVLWTTNTSLISNVSISNPAPGSLGDITNSKILVVVNPNQSGNAVVTLHNGSITNPVYWSWHIWVTDTPISAFKYTTELPNGNVTNYINYVEKADIALQTEFMDRNLGATDSFPLVANNLTPTSAELAKIRASTGLHYQWGRKDPIPTFQNADNRASYNVFLGSVQANGSVNYTTLTAATYNNTSGSYIVPYNNYAANANLQDVDKLSDKISKILSYSVRNPLVYMVPSTFASYNSSVPNYTNGTDWLSTEPNLAPDRWGRGGEKSPFDPCPAGWRIPDVSGVAIVSGKDFGMTPWYKKDKNVATVYSIANDYLGVRVRNPSTTTTIGYIFNNPAYPIGNYPNSGSRGFRSVTGNQSAQGTYNALNFQYPGFWTGALTSNYIGRPVNMLFDAASSANRMIAFHDNNDPYFGMSCRCVKIKYDENGNEEGVIPKLQITSLPATKAATALNKNEIADIISKEKISVFPNPVKNELHIKAPNNNEGYYYQIYDMSGKLVKSGKFENGQIDLSALSSGGYLIRINNSKSIIKIIKE
ncbi:T9SS type A sorting domain-containing protein [Chryseobacterium paridis]|uniref:T9SS type A sorting domain-containing protein n=1 Tax=Chryseobacterium paridis TaxID=2800328 RepID=A0ABS1FRP7_9FLAO|nr:T9SS type A sorting domain-containing protein [Chryseobacterium paridis]MBK1895097.1 T9SS type A sorting domain-containing protein [Chryseobacterium paridis]